MMRNEFRERVEQLLQQKEINENSELSHLFRLAIQNLDRNEKYQSVMANLSQGLSLYLMTHHYQAPKSVIDFGLWIAKAPSQERGRLAFLQMLAQTNPTGLSLKLSNIRGKTLVFFADETINFVKNVIE